MKAVTAAAFAVAAALAAFPAAAEPGEAPFAEAPVAPPALDGTALAIAEGGEPTGGTALVAMDGVAAWHVGGAVYVRTASDAVVLSPAHQAVVETVGTGRRVYRFDAYPGWITVAKDGEPVRAAHLLPADLKTPRN